MQNNFGMVRITAASNKVSVGNPSQNVVEILTVLKAVNDSKIVLFPELCISGYTCGELFNEDVLLNDVEEQLRILVSKIGNYQIVVVGAPIRVGNGLYNCAVVMHNSTILGIVPKQFLPNYKEFYENRWFSAANGSEPKEIYYAGEKCSFGIDLLFQLGSSTSRDHLTIGVEICEDLWMPIQPSSFQSVAGANVILNLSASNETVAKSVYRENLVVGQSARCMAAYVYASAGPSESTTDLVFGGHCLIAENGSLLAQSEKFIRENHSITADVDVERCMTDRRVMQDYTACARYLPFPYRIQPIHFMTLDLPVKKTWNVKDWTPKRPISQTPFVPREGAELDRRCAEIFGIQTCGLAKRLEMLPEGTTLNVGISGGLDSTLAGLVAVKACDLLGRSRKLVRGYTLPGFGTSNRTKFNAVGFMDLAGMTQETIDIRAQCIQMFKDLGHQPFGIDLQQLYDEVRPGWDFMMAFTARLADLPPDKRDDLVFENVQARVRTSILMNKGFVVGTGDLSEAALGWSTYNGDQQSMYNPNCSIPKTLVRFLVEYVADQEMEKGNEKLGSVLYDIVRTTISPELLPVGKNGACQSSEDKLGPYVLHDFFLFNMVRNHYSPEKIMFLAQQAGFDEEHVALLPKVKDTFYRRFFSQQYKRSSAPDGPKVGSVDLSQRGSWRMPSDADSSLWRL